MFWRHLESARVGHAQRGTRRAQGRSMSDASSAAGESLPRSVSSVTPEVKQLFRRRQGAFMRLHSAAHTAHTLTRRDFFGRLGAVTAAVWASGHNPFAAGFVQGPDTSLPGQFGRMFRLPPFLPATDAIREALLEVGKPGGIMDADDNIRAGPVALIVEDALNKVNRNSTTHTAGLTFLGQFLDHDITFDSTSRLGFPTSPSSRRTAGRRFSISTRSTPAAPRGLPSSTTRPQDQVQGRAVDCSRFTEKHDQSRGHSRRAQRREPDHLGPAHGVSAAP